jgi:hypothetical protein
MCIIIYKKINGKTILAKNRDRPYRAKIQIVHEIRNGVEIAYMRDMNTEWCEGLNQFGVGIINAALEVEYDENPFAQNGNFHEISKQRYLNALASIPEQLIDKTFDHHFYTDITLQGHNLIGGTNFGIHLESNAYVLPSAKILNENQYVYTNHGINLKNSGYLDGISLSSSVLRQQFIIRELNNAVLREPTDIFNVMNKNYGNLHHFLHPYKNYIDPNATRNLMTTGQILLNLTDKIFTYAYDLKHSDFYGIVNNLPPNYVPVIKINTIETTKTNIITRPPLSDKEIQEIINKYS